MAKAVNEFAARGFRSLGVSRADGDGQWQFLGVLPLFDPPREDAKATIATALAMGVKIKMVTGDALANAAMESFWSSLKRELVPRCQFATRAEARAAIFEWIEVFYNRERLHRALGYHSPVDFETDLN